jgi:hypothetical protein
MTNFDWAKLSVKLMGLWALISALRSVTNVAEAFFINQRAMTWPSNLAISALSPLALALIGLYLWIRGDLIASSIFPEVKAVEPPGAEDQERLLPLALSLMGVWLVSGAIPTLVYYISVAVISFSPANQGVSSPGYLPPSMIVTAKANAIAALARAFIGFGLLLGSERLTELISAMRGRQSVSK